MARGSLAGLPSVAREAIDPGAGWQEVPWAHQGNRRFQIGDGLHLKLRRGDAGRAPGGLDGAPALALRPLRGSAALAGGPVTIDLDICNLRTHSGLA